MEQRRQRQQHFLVVTYPAQGHINPALQLAAHRTALVTFSSAVSAHRKMFPSSPVEEFEDGPITYIPYSDGYDDGFIWGTHDIKRHLTQSKTVGSATLSSVVRNLTARGRSVDCIVYTFLLQWVADVARSHGVPSVQYWIEPATAFAIYHHYFHGYNSLIAAHSKDPMFKIDLPSLPPLRIRDLPSFLTISPDDPYAVFLDMVRVAFDTLERERVLSNLKPKVLMNTFEELEKAAVSAVEDMDLIPIGPMTEVSGIDLFEQDERKYMEWLDLKPEKSVVYVSFGSVAVVQRKQMQEIAEGLKGSGRPYLWVARRDCRWEGLELEDDEGGIVVRWCSQVRVLSHPSVGCFVTHCGWNSTVESIVYGVPTVGVPQWSDQGTSAMLAEKVRGTGVRGEANGDGVLEREELKRCLELVMGEGERGAEIRRNVRMWRDKATEATTLGGSSEQNLKTFVDAMAKFRQN